MERLDGSGYPEALRGDAISLHGRIAGVVDSFDAMTSERPYRRRLSWPEAIEQLRDGCPSSYDPIVVEALEELVSGVELARSLEQIQDSAPYWDADVAVS